MKTKKIVLTSVLLLLLLCVMCTTKSYGICFDMRIEGEESVHAGDTIYLNAFYFIGNDLGRPYIVREDIVTEEAIWTSSDESIVKVAAKFLHHFFWFHFSSSSIIGLMIFSIVFTSTSFIFSRSWNK